MNLTRRLYPQELLKVAQARQQPQTPPAPAPAPATDVQPTVTVVLLSLDRLHLTRRCIDSLVAHSDYPFRLWVHDDGSQPDTVAYVHGLRDRYDNVTLSDQPAGLGWAAARNRAFAAATTDYVFSLDNDMICHPGWLRETMACAVRHGADFVAPLRLNPDGSVWSFAPELIRTEGETVLEIARWFHDLSPEAVRSLFGGADVSTNFVSGGAGLFRRAAFERCGGFDEGYAIGFEDLDFALVLAEKGYTVWATPLAALTHDDEWQPLTDADRSYAQTRYDRADLERASALFRERWNLDVLPAKYAASFQERLERKLAGGR